MDQKFSFYCHGLDAMQKLDYTHMKENIYKFAHSAIRGSKASVNWATELKDLVKEGKIEEAIKKAEPYKDTYSRT